MGNDVQAAFINIIGSPVKGMMDEGRYIQELCGREQVDNITFILSYIL